uniref:Uncharacterized protein n=1 Tax=Chromera velia CCMP2878 TaxID=1169474 RepID=A0A0G4GN84_9ALVE|eukprot:Cvel_22643.t1-p1 / transcript=Cvel_22643.t1 / gene=Cvel_22643 / organism=Chromera_velia_CCMP2878 / gene_product=hypothetical protein / transcript_product=hypothetical protein / location=Cvel_scaffold2247:6098-9688(-) / protein_length=439 / sequence_SO=supercontig / SO=protein_coding / is_pseudo=false
MLSEEELDEWDEAAHDEAVGDFIHVYPKDYDPKTDIIVPAEVAHNAYRKEGGPTLDPFASLEARGYQALKANKAKDNVDAAVIGTRTYDIHVLFVDYLELDELKKEVYAYVTQMKKLDVQDLKVVWVGMKTLAYGIVALDENGQKQKYGSAQIIEFQCQLRPGAIKFIDERMRGDPRILRHFFFKPDRIKRPLAKRIWRKLAQSGRLHEDNVGLERFLGSQKRMQMMSTHKEELGKVLNEISMEKSKKLGYFVEPSKQPKGMFDDCLRKDGTEDPDLSLPVRELDKKEYDYSGFVRAKYFHNVEKYGEPLNVGDQWGKPMGVPEDPSADEVAEWVADYNEGRSEINPGTLAEKNFFDLMDTLEIEAEDPSKPSGRKAARMTEEEAYAERYGTFKGDWMDGDGDEYDLDELEDDADGTDEGDGVEDGADGTDEGEEEAGA